MLKIFDVEDLCVKKFKNDANSKIITMSISAKLLDQNIFDMIDTITKELAKVDVVKNMYFKINIFDDCSKEDVEDFYDYIEIALTRLFCTDRIKKERIDRLGTFGLPILNMKINNLLKWAKYETKITGIGFEVRKSGSFWSKRMVK